MSDLLGTYLGQYQLTAVISHGGTATVYKAHQASLDRFVAIKVMYRSRDPQFAARFKREARVIAQLQHPNILPIYEYGEQDGLLYLVLRYIETETTLHDLIGAPMAPPRALHLTTLLLDALAYAHARGIIHRDVKPANVLMAGEDWPMLADFGIAKLASEDQQLTYTGLIIGTAAYMSPEQATGETTDARSDLYSTGVVLYELLTGRPPFEATNAMAVLNKHVYAAPPAPRLLVPGLPVAVEAAVLRALTKDVAQRYQSAAAMADALRQIGEQLGTPSSALLAHSAVTTAMPVLPVAVLPVAKRRSGREPSQRPRWAPWATLALGTVLLSGGGSVGWLGYQQATAQQAMVLLPAHTATLTPTATAPPTATATATPAPTAPPTATATAIPAPTALPTATATAIPAPTAPPTARPAIKPTALPTARPVARPTAPPAPQPTTPPATAEPPTAQPAPPPAAPAPQATAVPPTPEPQHKEKKKPEPTSVPKPPAEAPLPPKKKK